MPQIMVALLHQQELARSLNTAIQLLKAKIVPT